MIVAVAEDREAARVRWRECRDRLPVEPVRLAMEIFPGSEVVSFTLADEEHQIPGRERIEARLEPQPKKEWW